MANFKVDYEQLYLIGSRSEKEVDNIDRRIDELLKIVEDLKSYWNDEAYENFSGNSTVYLNNLKEKMKELKYLASFAKLSSNVYSKTDDAWGVRMKAYREDKEWPIQQG